MPALPSTRRSLAAAFLLATLAAPAAAQQVDLSKEAYLTPPKVIADAVLAAERGNVALTNLSPDGKTFLVPKSDGLPPLARLARPCVYLGEMAFDHQAYRSRQLWVRSLAGYELFYPAEQKTVAVHVPKGARVSNAAWSPDGSRLAYFAHFDDATHICVAACAGGESKRLTAVPVLATLVTSFQWSKDGKQIVTLLRPDDGKRPPPARGAAAAPRVRVAREGANPSRTYRFLLESADDAGLLEHLTTGQLALINVDDGRVTRVGEPAMIRRVSAAPGEQLFRVAEVKKPFSYYVPLTRFGSVESVWDRGGKALYTLFERGIQDADPATQPPQPTQAAAAGGRNRAGGAGQPPVPGQPVTDPQPPADPDTPPRFAADRPDPDGRRDLTWRPDGAGLSFLQLEPADPKDATKPRKDRVVHWAPPFEKDKAQVVYETPHRISSLQYSPDAAMIFLTQTVDNQRQISAIDLKDPNKPLYVLHKTQARVGDGTAPPAGAPRTANTAGGPEGLGRPALPLVPALRGAGPERRGASVLRPHAERGDEAEDLDAASMDDDEQRRGPGFGAGAFTPTGLLTRAPGTNVVRISSGGDVYLSGSERPRGAGAPAFPKPYLDRINIKTGKRRRVFEGKGDLLETIDAVDGDDVKFVFTTRQKTDVVPDSYVTELATGKSTKLTSNVNPAPWFRQLEVERIQVTRVDGFKFWAKVSLPPAPSRPPAGGGGPGGGRKLPALFWIYPREYTDQAAYNAAAGRTAATSQRFAAPAPRSMTILTRLGYAVVEPDVPIVGPAGRMNDNYIPDLRNSLWAVIDELDKRGIIDRGRLAVGGHSYGAFSAANAMIHTPFFKAGIAGDGNYNRTLTMMTFQTERRPLWDARETYLEMSPLLFANRLSGALLMYHGMDDANVGTNPINAEHMFMALDGLGKPAALYMYPYEGHGPASRETTLDLWARWAAWLDTYVKNSEKKG